MLTSASVNTQVGGLPCLELNHLEIQFLFLNQFRLHIDVETLDAYATMLVEFYARECIARPSLPARGRRSVPAEGIIERRS